MVHDGRVQLLEQELAGVNGIVFSPDEKVLFVNGGGTIYRYDVRPDGSIANRRVLIDKLGRSDGMKVDERGNIYCSAAGGVWVISPEGKHLGTLPTTDNATNVAFGGADRRMVYITGQRTLYRIRALIPGPRPLS
jgi:gluconolactonase